MTLADFARIVLILTFATAALAKWRKPQLLAARLRTLGLGPGAARVASASIASIELLLVVLLFAGIQLAATASFAAILLSLFSLSIVVRPAASGCGCGLPAEQLGAPVLLVRNAILACTAGGVAYSAGAGIVAAALCAMPAVVIAVVAPLTFASLAHPHSGTASRT